MTVLGEVFNGLVAAGTLGLAAGTFVLARSTSSSVKESTKARLDAVAPSIVVLDLWVAPRPVNPRITAKAQPIAIDPGTPWSMAQHGAAEIGVQAGGSLVNEGPVTAQLMMRSGPEVEVEYVTTPKQEGFGSVPVSLQGDYYVIQPGVTVSFGFILWRSAQQWAEEWNTSSGNPPSALGHVDLEITSARAQSAIAAV